MDTSTNLSFNSINTSSLCWKLSLKDRVSFILASKGMTKSDYAFKIGINKGTLTKILNEDWIPTAKIKIIMAHILDVDSLVLFGDKNYFLDYKKTIQKNYEGEKNE